MCYTSGFNNFDLNHHNHQSVFLIVIMFFSGLILIEIDAVKSKMKNNFKIIYFDRASTDFAGYAIDGDNKLIFY